MSRQIYCGNNLYEVGGNTRIGTPYECLKKGIGQGLNLDLTGFNPNYQAIIPDNTYCGTRVPPAGKQMGTPMSCLRKGVGLGRKLQYDRGGGGQQPPPPTERIVAPPPMIPRPGRVVREDYVDPMDSYKPPWRWEFPMRWWPIIVALLVGVVAAIFRATYTTILLTMIVVLLVSWFVQSLTER